MNAHRDITPSARSVDADPRPPSAVSSGVGIAGMVGLLAAIAVGRMTGANGPVSSMLAVVACGLPMVLWTVFVDKAWKNESTGLDWNRPLTPHDETRDISIAKLAGLWATWCSIAAIYCIGRWYWDGQYLFAMRMLAWAAPVMFVVSIPYIFWIDRRLKEPKDGAYMFGAWLTGERADIEAEKLIGHFRSWAVKGFFTAFMISIVPGNWFEVLSWSTAQITSDPVQDLLRGGQTTRGQQYKHPIIGRAERMQFAVSGYIIDTGIGAGVGAKHQAIVQAEGETIGHSGALLGCLLGRTMEGRSINRPSIVPEAASADRVAAVAVELI